MTKDALSVVDKAIQAVSPVSAVKNHLRFDPDNCVLRAGASESSNTKSYNLQDFDDILIVAFGKASSAMATTVIKQLTEQNMSNGNIPSIQGIVVVKDEHCTSEEQTFLESHNTVLYEASHPVPDKRGSLAAKEIMARVSTMASPRSLVICCISGGGSALFCLPQDRLSLDDLKKTSSVLLASGLSIQEINVIRKRLEDGKGGRLAAAAYPSTVLSLVLSDVLGDPLDLIASGPTVPDTSSFIDAWQLIEKNGLQTKLPSSVVQMIKDGLDGSLPDSPSEDHPIFQEGKCKTVVVANNELAVEAAAAEAKRRGYGTVVLGSRIEGEAKHAATFYSAMAQHLALQREEKHVPFPIAKLPTALIAGGETTVSIGPDADGKGGRNQELGLAAALKFKELGLRNVVLASVGTDGTDGPTDAAGAVVDGATVARLTGSVEDALRRHDAYNYLNQVEEDGHTPLIITGPTGTNVADVCVVLIR